MSAFSCVEWNGHKDRDGYPLGEVDGKLTRMHRQFVDADVDGMHVHHKCGNKGCVNPRHLEVISPEEHNSLHKTLTHCKRGHELSGDNLYVYPYGRRCKACVLDRYRRKKVGV